MSSLPDISTNHALVSVIHYHIDGLGLIGLRSKLSISPVSPATRIQGFPSFPVSAPLCPSSQDARAPLHSSAALTATGWVGVDENLIRSSDDVLT